MLSAYDCELKSWKADFSSAGLDSPFWTRLIHADLTIVNGLEAVDWQPNPVQVIICDHCGTPRCTGANFVHIARIADHLIWTAPDRTQHDDWERDEFSGADFLNQFGALLVHKQTWAEWASKFQSLPDFGALPVATRSDVARTWLLETKGRANPDDLMGLPGMLERDLLATDHNGPGEAIEIVRGFVSWLAADPDGPVSGSIDSIALSDQRPERFYFDGPSHLDWYAYMEAEKPTLLFGRHWALELT